MDENIADLDSVQAQRKALSSNLAHIILVSREKFDCERVANHERRAWARLVISGIEAYAKLLEISALEDLAARVERLETREGAVSGEGVEK
jgi:BMFP domain-containing protein YqiC